MGMPIEFYIYVGYGLFAMVVVFAGLNFLLGGFLRPFLEVKRSRGAKLLVEFRNQTQNYFRAGQIDEGFLVVTDRNKNERRIPMIGGVVERKAGILWVKIDDVKNVFIKSDDGAAVSGFDAVKYDELYKRALYKPPTLGDNLMKFILIIGIITLLVGLVAIYLTYRGNTATNEALTILKSMAAVTQNVTGQVV